MPALTLVIAVYNKPENLRMFNPATGSDIWVLPLPGTDPDPGRGASAAPSGGARPFLKTSFSEGDAVVSPDGRWFAYTSAENGRPEVYATSYPGLTGKQQISVQGGRLPLWSARSGELFFLAGDTLMASVVSSGSGLDWTTPKPLFASPDLGSLEYTFSVSADGRRFLYPARNPEASAREIQLVLNWFSELKSKARQ